MKIHLCLGYHTGMNVDWVILPDAGDTLTFTRPGDSRHPLCAVVHSRSYNVVSGRWTLWIDPADDAPEAEADAWDDVGFGKDTAEESEHEHC